MTDLSPRVLLIGLRPEAVDLSNAPIDLATLRGLIAAGDAAIVAAGYDARFCQIDDDLPSADEQVRAALAEGPWDAVMIGAGIRAVPRYTELFELLVNLAHTLAPAARIAFNASPDTTLDALRRVLD